MGGLRETIVYIFPNPIENGQSILYFPNRKVGERGDICCKSNTIDDFEVIKIMGDKDPYPTLLGIDWAYDNYDVIDLKRDTMTFEANKIKVVHPLDLYVGPRYMETTKNNI